MIVSNVNVQECVWPPFLLSRVSDIPYFPLRSRSMVRINTEVCSRITLKSSKGCATLEPNQSGRIYASSAIR